MADAEKITVEIESNIESSVIDNQSQPEPEISTVAPPVDTTVTSVTEQIVVKKEKPPAPSETLTVTKAPKKTTQESLSSKMASSKSYKSSSKRTTFREYTDSSTLLSDLSRDYRGTSPAVLENIATHPVLYCRQYMPDISPTKLSARSKKVIRDAEDLARTAPGLKNMLEVQYLCYICALLLCACCLQ